MRNARASTVANRLGLLSGLVLLAGTSSAQITVPITGYQVGTSATASPNAAYSNITNYLGTTVGTGAGGLSATLFSNLTATPALQGQTVQALRLGVTCSAFVPNNVPTRRVRVQVGFWNADGPNGTAGTPVQGVAGFAQYQSDVLTMPGDQAAIITLSLGGSGFVVPSGQFYFGLAYDVRDFSESAATEFLYNLYGLPTVGTIQQGLYGATYGPGAALYGLPWGAIFGTPGQPTTTLIDAGPGTVGIELIVPAPSSGALFALGGALAFRRRRRS